jgi:hypothetical protein
MLNALTQAVYSFLVDNDATAQFERNISAFTRQTLSVASTIEPPAESQTRQSSHSAYVHYREAYVARPKLEAEFKQLLADPKIRVIVLVGQSGMGKTWLAEELTRDQHTGDPAPSLDVSSLDRLAVDQAGAFSRLGIKIIPGMSPATQVASLVCGEKAPPVVVLDNLESADRLRELLPRHTRSKIVAICRSANESQLYSMLSVERMERPESLLLIRGRLPNLLDEDAEYLAWSFGDYPLVIWHVCTVFPNQQSSMRVICDSLQRDARQLAGEVKAEGQAILLVILRRTVKIVVARDRQALDLLSIISFIGHLSYKSYLAIAFQGFVAKESIPNFRFAMAIAVLKEFALVQFDSSPDGEATIHPFTQAILRRELESKAERIFVLVTQVMMTLYLDYQFAKDFTKEIEESGIDASNEHERAQFFHTNSKARLAREVTMQWLHCLCYWAEVHHPEWESYSKEKQGKVFDSLLQKHGFRVEAVNPAEQHLAPSAMQEIVQIMNSLWGTVEDEAEKASSLR